MTNIRYALWSPLPKIHLEFILEDSFCFSSIWPKGKKEKQHWKKSSLNNKWRGQSSIKVIRLLRSSILVYLQLLWNLLLIHFQSGEQNVATLDWDIWQLVGHEAGEEGMHLESGKLYFKVVKYKYISAISSIVWARIIPQRLHGWAEMDPVSCWGRQAWRSVVWIF